MGRGSTLQSGGAASPTSWVSSLRTARDLPSGGAALQAAAATPRAGAITTAHPSLPPADRR